MKRIVLISACMLCFASFLNAGGSIEKAIVSEVPLNVIQTGKSETTWKTWPLNQACSGINIHFVRGHEKDLDMIAAAGFKYIRMDFGWESTEAAKGKYTWAAYDELTANLEKRGLGAIYILDYSNSLYETVVESKDPLTNKVQKDIASPQNPESVAAFARWSAAAAEHFKDKNIIWEIWNEPNIFFWKPVPDVKQYIALALATTKAVKTAVPGAVIVGPATSEVPMPFLETFLASGVLEYLDAVSVHPYREYSKSPETAMTDYKNLRDLIERYAPEGKKKMPIISSEWGYSSATKDIPIEKQSLYIVRMQLANLLNGIRISIWYDWKNDGDDPADHEQNFGTVTSALKIKPAYTTIQTMNMQLKNFTLLHRIDLKNENDYALLFRDNKGNYRIAAWTTEQPHSVTMEKIIVRASGSAARDGKGNILKIRTDNDRHVLDLSGLPQYISLPGGISVD